MICQKIYLPFLVVLLQLISIVYSVSEIIPFGVNNAVQVPNVFTVNITSNQLDSAVPRLLSIRTQANITNKRINFVAIHGRNSEIWSLSSSTESIVTLCIGLEGNLTSIVIIAQVEGDSSSTESAEVNILVESFKEFLLFEQYHNASITEDNPLTLLVNHSDRSGLKEYSDYENSDATIRDHFILTVENGDNEETVNTCVVVTVQNRECPLKNRPDNVETAKMYATMLSTMTMTIRASRKNFLEPFYVNVVVLPNDFPCRILSAGDENHNRRINATLNSGHRKKNVRVRIEKAPYYSTYLTPIAMAAILMFIVIVISTSVLLAKTYEVTEREHFAPEMSQCNPREDNGYPRQAESVEANGNRTIDVTDSNGASGNIGSGEIAIQFRPQAGGDDAEDSIVVFLSQDQADEVDGVAGLQSNDVAFKLNQECRSVINSRPKDRRIRIKKGLNRLREDATLKDMASILNDDVWFRRNRSRVYLYLIPIVSIFYFVPAIQFAFLAKQNEDETGSQDLCYHNFKCSKPFSMFSDFNHVVSNMSYWVFGLAFVVLVYVKSVRLPEKHHPKNDHHTNTGILQQLSIFYGMGFALIFQGFFSICYHVCPTNLSLQFDTTMMYLICLLCYIKIYQFRHPDATPNAYSVFMFLGVLVLIEALALYSTSWWVFGLFLVFYVTMTLFVAFDCYYIGIGRLDKKVAWILAKDIVSNWRPVLEEGKKFNLAWIRYPWRFFFSFIFCFVNFVYAGVTIHSKFRNPRKTVTHVVLTILAGNMMLYLFYYVIRKNCIGHRGICSNCRKRRDSGDGGRMSCNVCTRRFTVFGFRFPIPLSAGTFFSVTALIFGGIALNFYYDRTANRNLSPAESRNLNADCTVLDFFDGHDLWHFFSAAGIFMAFLALLTVDDDLLDIPRSEIEVF